MCNQITNNVGGHLSPEEAADKAYNHLMLFWAKSMKEDLVTYYKNDGALLSELSKLVAKRFSEG